MQTASIDMKRHVAIHGETQSGKTTLANKLKDNFTDHGVLYIDLEDMNEIDAVARYDNTSNISQLHTHLKQGKTVRYVPDAWDDDTRVQEIQQLLKLLIFEWNVSVYVVVDEIQEYGGSTNNVFDVAATRGLKRGVHLVSITQRPAKLSNTIATQTTTFIFFEVGEFERSYFQRYNLPFTQLMQGFDSVSGDHWFQVYTRGSGLSQPLKLKYV